MVVAEVQSLSWVGQAMFKIKFLLFISIISVLFALPFYSYAASGDYNRVINLAGKQRMLTQKMSKEVLLVALDVGKAANLENLKYTRDLFDKTLLGLRHGDTAMGLPTTYQRVILTGLDKVDILWRDFDLALSAVLHSGSASAPAVERIAKKNLPLLWAMDDVVKLYEIDSVLHQVKPQLASAINIAGRQRMLSQKMTKEYLLIALGLDVDENKRNLQATIDLFDVSLKGLLHGDASLRLIPAPETVSVQLNVVQSIWDEYRKILESEVTPENIEVVTRINVELLTEMDRAVSMYESL